MIETSYDSLTNSVYTSEHYNKYGLETNNGFPKTQGETGSPKSATSTSFVLDFRSVGNERYVKWWVWATAP